MSGMPYVDRANVGDIGGLLMAKRKEKEAVPVVQYREVPGEINITDWLGESEKEWVNWLRSSEKLDLAFVDDDHIRGVLEDYYAQARNAFCANACLGTIVACGGVVEGLLTWSLLRYEEQARRSKDACKYKRGEVTEVMPLQQWNLNNLIKVATELDLVGEKAEKAAWALMDFRNFIHPYNVAKQSFRPNRNLATSALAATNEIVRSVRRRLTQGSQGR